MDVDDKWSVLARLDDELLVGGAVLSEWCAAIVREADIAFVHGANLGAILTAVSAIETYLRAENLASDRLRLVDLITASTLPADLKDELHLLRRYRNRWVHVGDPTEDQTILENPKAVLDELQTMAFSAMRTLRKTIYSDLSV